MLLSSDKNRPSVVIGYKNYDGCYDNLREIDAGLEEEGIPYMHLESSQNDIDQIGYESACQSILGVGIGLSEGEVCIHYNRLSPERPLFKKHFIKNNHELRFMGCNAARLVKGTPFKVSECNTVQENTEEELARLIGNLVRAMINQDYD